MLPPAGLQVIPDHAIQPSLLTPTSRVNGSSDAAGAPLSLTQAAEPGPLQLDQPPRTDLLANIVDDLGDVVRFPFTMRSNESLYFIPSVALIGLTLTEDLDLYPRLHDPRNSLYDQGMPYLTSLGDGVTDLAICGLLYGLGGDKGTRAADLSLEALADTGVTVFVLKGIFSAVRPEKNSNDRRFFDYGGSIWDGSFPSGHTAAAFTLAAVLGKAYHMEFATYGLAAGVAYSRIYLSKHWPSDVLAGAVLGTWMGLWVMDKRGWSENTSSLVPEIKNGVPSLHWRARW